MKTAQKAANYINHIALVLDASGSMGGLETEVVAVADQQIAHLAQRSKELDQETRVTVYTFDYTTNIQCHFYDKDVLRLPSLKGLYRPDGQTALVDATLKALDDLAKTPELYGDHSFLTYVLTDGQENASKTRPEHLTRRLHALPDHWTMAAFVPNASGLHEAKKFGFPRDNVAVWDASGDGVHEVGETIRRATDAYMTARSVGVRGSRNLFALDTSKLSRVATSTMVRLGPGQFRKFQVKYDIPIANFVEEQTKRPYNLGEGFYQLTVPVLVQPQKVIALYERKSHCVFVGQDARTLLGLPDYKVKVTPASHPDYDIFIQSTSVNRRLLQDTGFLLLSGQRV